MIMSKVLYGLGILVVICLSIGVFLYDDQSPRIQEADVVPTSINQPVSSTTTEPVLESQNGSKKSEEVHNSSYRDNVKIGKSVWETLDTNGSVKVILAVEKGTIDAVSEIFSSQEFRIEKKFYALDVFSGEVLQESALIKMINDQRVIKVDEDATMRAL